MSLPRVDLLIVGAGPAGLSCAIEAKKAGLSVRVLDQGGLVDAIRRFPVNLVWFSTPELLEIGGIPFPIAGVRPTRVETIAYYQRVASHYALDVAPHRRVEAVEPVADGFRLVAAWGEVHMSRFVVVATGYMDTPNRLGVEGEDLPTVLHSYDEPFRYYGCDVAVVGGRNSAVEAALDLYRHGARVTLVHRGGTLSPGVKYWILPDFENRLKAGQIRGQFSSAVTRFRPGVLEVSSPGGEGRVKADFAFVLIGFRPDTSLLLRFGLQVDPETLGPVHDPETFETTRSGMFVAGSVVAGKFNNRVFVENGRLHGAAIVSALVRKTR
jgi:thioredoxin reductase (NADPH)